MKYMTIALLLILAPAAFGQTCDICGVEFYKPKPVDASRYSRLVLLCDTTAVAWISAGVFVEHDDPMVVWDEDANRAVPKYLRHDVKVDVPKFALCKNCVARYEKRLDGEIKKAVLDVLKKARENASHGITIIGGCRRKP